MNKSNKSYRFVKMTRPLDYAVYNGKKLMIPAGAVGVKIAFRQSHLRRKDENGNEVPMNVYLYKGRLIHA